MKHKYNQELPKNIEKQLDDYVKRIQKIKWFQPAGKIKQAEIEKQVKIACEAFGVKASVEYKTLKTPQDWEAAREAAWGAAREAAWGAAWEAARGAAWGAARGAAWKAARGAAWGAARGAAWKAAREAAWGAAKEAAWGAADILALNTEEYKKKYPKGNFVNLIPLWEIGLYPVGIVNKKFVIYIPPYKKDFPEIV